AGPSKSSRQTWTHGCVGACHVSSLGTGALLHALALSATKRASGSRVRIRMALSNWGPVPVPVPLPVPEHSLTGSGNGKEASRCELRRMRVQPCVSDSFGLFLERSKSSGGSDEVSIGYDSPSCL